MSKDEFLRGLQPKAVGCRDFTSKNGIKRVVTIIIAPIGVKKGNEGTTVVMWACSRGPYCFDSECRYSAIGNPKAPTKKISESKKYFSTEVENFEEEEEE